MVKTIGDMLLLLIQPLPGDRFSGWGESELGYHKGHKPNQCEEKMALSGVP